MRVGSLFSGIGGFDLGFEQAGMEVAWQCEIDKHARAVLAKHWPGVPCYDGIRSIRAGDVPAVDLICGGFPCQDVSVAGRRAGLAGERSGLWFEFHRVLEGLRPAWVVIENVPGLLSSNGGRDMGTILGGLGDLGYRWAYGVLDAQWFRVAQRRRRVFIVGHLGDGRAADVLPLPKGLCGDPPARGAAGEGVAGTLGGSSQSGGFRTTDLDNNGSFVVQPRYARNGRGGPSGIAYPLTAEAGRTGRGDSAQFVVAIQDTREMQKVQNGIGVSADGVGYTLDGTGSQGVYVPEVVGALYTVAGAQKLDTQSSANGHLLAVGGRYWDGSETAATLDSSMLAKRQTMPDKGRFAGVITGGVRRLTPTECERLQGFPDGWTAGQADSHRYRQLGNAVAVPVAEWIGERIMGGDYPRMSE